MSTIIEYASRYGKLSLYGGTLVISAVLYVIISSVYYLYLSPLRRFPGPRLWCISNIPFSFAWMAGDVHKRVFEIHQKYGDVVRLAPNQLSFGYPEAWNDVMGHRKREQDENGKDSDFWQGEDKLTLVGSSRERHARIRKALSHGFSAQAMMEQQPIFRHYVSLMMEKLEVASTEGSIDMVKWLNWTTFDLAGDLIFGEPFGCLEKLEYHPWVNLLFMHLKGIAISTGVIRFPFANSLIKLLTPKNVARDIKAHAEYTEAQVAKRITYKNPRSDLMESMIKAYEKGQVTYREVLANAHNLIVGGSETTATTLLGSIYLLTTHRPVLLKLQKELSDNFKTGDEIDLLSVQKLDYMFAVLHEGLRIYPAVPGSIPRRTPPGGSMIGKEYIPPDTIVGVWQWPLNHDPKFFKDAESFIPERWLGDPRFDSDEKAAFQPFAVGPRNCIGKNLAYAEMRLILAKLAWHFDFELDPRSENWLDKNVGYLLWEKPALFIKLTPRNVAKSGR